MPFYSAARDGKEGAWIGIDLGTTNCACAVWDSTRGRPKLLQLNDIARPRKGKVGRIVPSAVLLGKGDSAVSGKTKATVGYPALQLLEAGNDVAVVNACVTSVKRLVGATALQDDADFLRSLPFDIFEEDDESLSLSVLPVDCTRAIRVTPLEILTTILTAIRLASDQYLARYTHKKHLQVPGSSTFANNCVIGVPAHFGQRQRKTIEEACRRAGFTGHVSTIIESTAASMAYGLFVSVPAVKHILVLDMGGGTTDVTIAKLTPNEEFSVVATEGDKRLGGDDMDEAIFQLVATRLNIVPSRDERRSLLIACRKCKESLCGTEDDAPVDSYKISWTKDRSTVVSQLDFNEVIKPIVDRARVFVERIVDRSGSTIDEVVLVGGVTRVPDVQKMLLSVFPSIPEFCSSLNAEGAVAQGAAIQAAIKSGMVPIPELRSAMMLDALPHPIGVLLPDKVSYVPILEKNTQLPARGYATFTLAGIDQRGVTVIAVEDIGDSLEQIGEFTFLLRRLSNEELKLMSGTRTVDIGMTMEPSGEFIVSIFDENDPEHLRKKHTYQEQQKGGELAFETEINDDNLPTVLVVACAFLLVIYVAAKLAFHDPGETGSAII
jgi:molecular chaperone DnaK (HSP70)